MGVKLLPRSGAVVKEGPQFACLPNALLRRPSIRHRGDPPMAGLLSVFEFVVAGTCALLAREAIRAPRFAYAWAAGEKATRAQRRKPRRLSDDEFQQVKEDFEDATADAYLEDAEEAWKKHFPKVKLSCIGKTITGEGIVVRDKSGAQKLDAHGYVHFA